MKISNIQITKQLEKLNLNYHNLGFVTKTGFINVSNDYNLITLNDIYSKKQKPNIVVYDVSKVDSKKNIYQLLWRHFIMGRKNKNFYLIK